MTKAPTPKTEDPLVTEGGVDLSTLSVARGWLTLQKYSLTRGTRVLVGVTVLIVTLLIGAVFAYLSLGWMRDAATLHEVQTTVSTQHSQITQLEKNYSKLYAEYVRSAQAVPKAPPPLNADVTDNLVCPTGTVLKNLTVSTLTDGTQTFLGCQVLAH